MSAKDMAAFHLFDSEDHLTPEGAANGTRVVERGAVLVLVRGMTLLHKVPICIAKRRVTFNQDVKALVARPGTDARFLAYSLLARRAELLSAVELAGHGTGRLPTDRLKSLALWTPSTAEQIAIGDLLSLLDERADLNRRMNKTLDAMAHAVFKSWFVDFDPVRAKAEGRRPFGVGSETAALFPDSFGADARPEGWRWSTLGDEASRCGGIIQTGPFGSQLHAADYVEHGLPVVMPQDIRGRRVVTSDISRITPQDAERLSKHALRPGDLVYSRRGDVEKHALIGKREQGWLCGTGCLLVRLGDRWPSHLYVSLWVNQPEMRTWISQRAVGATMPNLNTTILSQTPILVPPEPVLRAFDDAVSPWQHMMVLNEGQAETLEALRDLLLRKLLSGALRVKDAETAFSAVV